MPVKNFLKSEGYSRCSSPAFGTISTSKTIRESPNIPLKSMLAAIVTS